MKLIEENKLYKKVFDAIINSLNLNTSLVATALTISEKLNTSLETVEEVIELMCCYGYLEPYNGPYLFCASPMFPYTASQKQVIERRERMGY